jgi:predicted Zn-dependent protease
MFETRSAPALAAMLLMLLVAACGETQGQRALTGALGGAVAGEVIADDPLAGAAIGGIGGALIR